MKNCSSIQQNLEGITTACSPARGFLVAPWQHFKTVPLGGCKVFERLAPIYTQTTLNYLAVSREYNYGVQAVFLRLSLAVFFELKYRTSVGSTKSI